MAKVFSGGTPSSSNPKFYGGDIPFIRSGEINSSETELFLKDEGLNNSSAKLVEKGDLLLAIYGATSGEVGVSRIKGAINQAILNDVDFELELIHRDDINVTYILKLLAKLKDAAPADREKQKKAIVELIVGESQLRSKRELIEKFINQTLPVIEDSEDIPEEFLNFWTKERVDAIKNLSEEESLDAEKLEQVIGDFIYTEKEPLRDDIIGMMTKRPSLRDRKSIAERVKTKIMDFVETFINGISAAA